MHPGAQLLIWLECMLAIQFAVPSGLLVIAGAALLVRGAWRKAWAYLRRARWLLLTLWLIIAYNTAGEAWLDQGWAPTYEGMREANLAALRLLAILVTLAALFARLGREGLQSALWGILVPFRAWGLEPERLVVRLALVMEGVEHLPQRGEWKKMLESLPEPDQEGVMSLVLVHWRARDFLLMVLLGVLLLGVVA